MDTWRGKWAVVTGASAGIGKALAVELAARGANLVLTARRRDRLEELARELAAKYAIRIEICAADLAQTSGPEEVFEFTKGKGIDVELLVNNAGFGAYGHFANMKLERILEMVQVNVSAVVHLTHLYLPLMIARKRGDILIVGSTASFQGVPFLTTYGATKAFDLVFAEALAEETRPHGVRVCALCPGSTTSEFHHVAGQPKHILRKQETAEKVARTGLRALASGKSYVISGTKNYAGAHIQRLLPRSFATRIVGKMFRPKAGGHA
ncbi:MAG TPA: SDR family oxidoreductase [Candidatus Acidoferrum sp.]|nr:SDR family oxidoreductase [Candidatus Acidoferrum sp.]